MSYIINKFNEGEVHIKENDVCGWLFESGEFRPLMDDAMQELLEAGLVNDTQVIMTHFAHEDYTKRTISDYREQQKNVHFSDEFLFELRAAFGEGETVVDVITGREFEL